MYIYNVTVNIESDVHDDWLQWMKEVHIPDVLATGFFIDNRIAQVMVDEEQGLTYSIQYRFKQMEDLQAYQQKHAARLQAEHMERYREKFVAFRTILRIDHESKA
jgi:antibiotic biosynthesis monooxygenase (ABM) superfamily enzyme